MHLVGVICILFIINHVESRYENQHQQCAFNSLCTCSHSGPDLGSVTCQNVPFLTIPPEVNNSAIYIMSLISNKLKYLDNNCLAGTGLWKLQINDNLLTDFPPNVFAGLEKTLKVLDLTGNDLVQIPKEATRNLEKLQNLNLASNHISFLHADDFQSLSKSLQNLDLSDNALNYVHHDTFRNMALLETLNLASNSLISIDDTVLYKGPYNLQSLNLMGNQLQQIPLTALANLKNLKSINLNGNLISSISEDREIRSKISLEELHLEHNLIKELKQDSFKIFSEINRLFLKGNPLTTVNETFIAANVTEIHMSQCSIELISRNALYGVADTLKILDLSDNNLVDFPHLPLRKLVELSLARNKISKIDKSDFKSYKNSLKYLDISGTKMGFPEGQIEMNLPNIRELKFNRDYKIIGAFYFNFIGPSIEKLYLTKNSIISITNGAFHHLSSLKLLDLSYNTISNIGNTTFKDVGHSLEKLVLHDSFGFTIFPVKMLHYLSKLQELDISSNRLSYLPLESFSSFHNIRYINLNHNKLTFLESNMFNEKSNPNLETLKIAFNKLLSLQSYTFKNFRNLLYLQLNDNLIKTIKKSTFLDLDSLVLINLEGNSITYIENEAFQNLPSVQFINLAYNNLSHLNLKAFDQVGRLSTVRIDVDHNKIKNLTRNSATHQTSSNIKIINFSHNYIQVLDGNYFDPIRHSISFLDLSYNNIKDLTSHAFSEMRQLETLIISHNEINVLEDNELDGLKKLQILDLSHNNITILFRKLFAQNRNLRVLSLSTNRIENLHEEQFTSTHLEYLDLSYNDLEAFPEETLLHINSTLQHLNINGNNIQHLNFSNIKSLFNLRHLSISENGMHYVSTDVEMQFSKLISMDLSWNPFDTSDKLFNYLPKALEDLNIANTNLTSMPKLDTPNLLRLNMSYNSIQSVLPESFENLNKIQILDFSNNLLSNVYNQIWSNLHNLRSLNLKANPIQSISNNSFSNMESLEELFMADLKLKNIENDILHELTSLKKIELDFVAHKSINLSKILNKNHGIKSIHLHVYAQELNGLLNGNLPKSLTKVVLEGQSLQYVEESALADIKNKDFSLDIRNSSVVWLSKMLFDNMKVVRNFSASFKNNKLQTLERILKPSHQREGKIMNLKKLELAGNELYCDCNLIWIWEWLKEYEHVNGCEEMISCDENILKDLRATHCFNRYNHSIIDVFKKELDCISGGSAQMRFNTLEFLASSMFTLILGFRFLF